MNKMDKYEDIKFEIGYFIDNQIFGTYRSIKTGVINLWRWRKIIWYNRWYDHSFLMTLIQEQLTYMRDNWKQSHYVGSEREEQTLRDLVKLLEEIEDPEDRLDYKSLSKKYQEFGRKLFDVTDRTRNETINGKDVEYIDTCSEVERLWD